MKIELLEYLALKTGGNYISDLKSKDLYYIQKIIQEIAPEECDLEEWKSCVKYLTDCEKDFTGCEEIKDYLLSIKTIGKF